MHKLPQIGQIENQQQSLITTPANVHAEYFFQNQTHHVTQHKRPNCNTHKKQWVEGGKHDG